MPKWKEGQSGNPKGRPKGSVSHSTEIRKILHTHSISLIETVVNLAKQGDLVALKMCLDRICPPLKASDECIELEHTDSPLEAVNTCMQLIADGVLPPNQAMGVINCITQKIKLEDVIERKESDPFKSLFSR